MKKLLLFTLLLTSGMLLLAGTLASDCDAGFSFIVDGATVDFINESESDVGAITSYYWTFGDGSSSTEENPAHIYDLPGAYEVCLVIEVAGECVDDRCELVVVGDAYCNADFLYTLAGYTISFEDESESGPGDIVSYAWDFGDGSVSDDIDPSHTYLFAGTYNVCLTIETEDGCTDMTCYTIVIGGAELCDAGFEWADDGLTVNFFDASEVDGDIISYLWEFGDGATSDAANPEHTYPFAGVYEVCLTIVTEGIGGTCTSTVCHVVIVGGVGADCSAAFDFEIDGSTVFFESITDPGPGDVSSYFWDFGDGTEGDGPNPEHTYIEPGSYWVCLTVVFADSCTAEYCDDILIAGGDCVVTAEVIGEDGLAQHFMASVDPDFDEITYTWYFGDGTTFTETTAGGPSDPWHEYTEPGTYHVCVVIETGAGCVDEYCFDIIIGGADCNANFEFEHDGLTYHFFDGSTGDGDVTYHWDFGDGTTSDAENPFHTFTEPGVYLVCLTVTYESGGIICTDEICYEIEVGGGGGDCISDFEFSADGLLVYFFETATGDVVDYNWDFGDGDESGDANPDHEYDEPGTYLVCLTIETASGCTDEFCWEVTVVETGGDCESDFEFDEDGLTVHFFETADGGGADVISYYWTFGDGGVSDDANPVNEYDEPGTYVVCLTISTSDSCTSTFCDEITIEDGGGGPCEAYFTISSMELTPDGWVVNFSNESAAAGDITDVTWYFGDGTTAETFDAEHIYTEPGLYVVCIVITTADGCTDEYCNELLIEGGDECESDFTWEVDGLNVFFNEAADGGGADIISYLWTFDDGTVGIGAEISHTYDEGGEYEVCLTIVTADSCIDTHCEWINLDGGGDDCMAGFEIDGIEETGSGWVVNFTNTSTGSDNYHWNFGDGGASEMESPEHLYTEPGIYLICLTIGVAGTDCFDEYCQEIFIGGDDDCVDVGLIDSAFECIEIYEPVCGCDGITYDNSCFAEYYGGVLFWTEGACDETGIQEENIFASVNIYPNPAQNSVVISYVVNANAEIRIDVLDIVGRSMTIPVIKNSTAGNYNYVLNTETFASGVYLVKISGAGNEQVQKLIISR